MYSRAVRLLKAGFDRSSSPSPIRTPGDCDGAACATELLWDTRPHAVDCRDAIGTRVYQLACGTLGSVNQLSLSCTRAESSHNAMHCCVELNQTIPHSVLVSPRPTSPATSPHPRVRVAPPPQLAGGGQHPRVRVAQPLSLFSYVPPAPINGRFVRHPSLVTNERTAVWAHYDKPAIKDLILSQPLLLLFFTLPYSRLLFRSKIGLLF